MLGDLGSFGRTGFWCGLLLATALSLGADAPKGAKVAKSKSEASKSIPSALKSELDKLGLRVANGSLNLAADVEFGKLAGDLNKHKTALFKADKEARAAEQEIVATKNHISELRTQYTQLNAELAGARGRSNADQNQIIGAVNATQSQMETLRVDQKKIEDNAKKLRAKATESREMLVEDLLNMRAASERLNAERNKLAADTAVQDAILKLNDATGQEYSLKPSPTFVAAEKKLKQLEDSVISETIKLTNEGDALFVDVVINGQHTKRMLIDSGATAISIPYSLAEELGIEPNSKDQQGTVALADGTSVPAWFITIGSVRVGKFIVKDAECVVLDRSAKNAPTLLGMSFLGKFKCEIDAQAAQLTLLKIDTGDEPAQERGRKSKQTSTLSKQKAKKTVSEPRGGCDGE